MRFSPPNRASKARQRGLVLIFSIIVLVALSLAAVGLMRSMLATNQIAGNLAFQQAAEHASLLGVETAKAWLDQQARAVILNPVTGALVSGNRLDNNIIKGPTEPIAYRALRTDPAGGQSWEAFWDAQVQANFVNDMPITANGFKVSYLIQRLCAGTGPRLTARQANCEMEPYQVQDPNSGKGGGELIPAPRPSYYRITVRAVGPRNAVSFTQHTITI